jgi:ubiquinone/menaquinone biosynthesis C-methylase UbiE
MTDDRVKAGYDTVATAYDQQFANQLDHKPLERGLLDAFCEMAPPGAIADIGCGPGHITGFLAERRDDVLGLDLSPEMIAVARRRHPRLRFAVASMLELPHADGVLTGVVAIFDHPHVPRSSRRDGRLLARSRGGDSRLARQRISRFGAA